MKITTWNVNSVNARIEHLIKFIKKDQSDIYLIQELKCTNESFPKEELENINYKCYVNGQKAWNGVAILSQESIEISNLKIPNYQDVNSRFIETEISFKNIKNKIKLINIYLPNGNPIETEKFDYKLIG
jgi:Exonuclease III